MSDLGKKKGSKFNTLRNTIFITIGLLLIIHILLFDLYTAFVYIGGDDCTGNVARLRLQGELVTYISPDGYDQDGYVAVDRTSSEDIVGALQAADDDPDIQAVILEIDSPGGSAVAAEEIEHTLLGSSKPTIALIREYGDSAAYWVATGASRIVASENSDVGGIGITMSYLDYSKKNEAEGIRYQQLSSGKFKDTGDPEKPLTDEERAYLERDISLMNENFIKTVSENRGLDIETVRALADGSSMLGRMALEKGLIDGIGGEVEAQAYLSTKYHIDSQICDY